MRTVLILNPTSGASTLAQHQEAPENNEEQILAALRTYDIEPEVHYTTLEDAGNGPARQAAEEGADIVIAAGGDGTLHAVASALIGTNSALGIIPMGTMNNIARSLRIPENIEEACAIIAHGVTQRIDVGKINEHIFLEVAGIGIEAALFPSAEEIKSSGWRSTIQGVFNGLATLFDFRPTRFAVSFDGWRIRRFSGLQISICNSPYYGARLQFAPNAVMDDGFLDVLIYKNFSKFAYIRHAISISQGQRALALKVTQRKVKTVRVRALQPVPIHADGVPKGNTPADITIEPGALRVRVPERVATGPNVVSPEKQQTQRYQKARSNTILGERGPLHVK